MFKPLLEQQLPAVIPANAGIHKITLRTVVASWKLTTGSFYYKIITDQEYNDLS